VASLPPREARPPKGARQPACGHRKPQRLAVPRPHMADRAAIDCRWLYKRRRSRSGSIRRYTNANTFSSGLEAMRLTGYGAALHVQPIPVTHPQPQPLHCGAHFPRCSGLLFPGCEMCCAFACAFGSPPAVLRHAPARWLPAGPGSEAALPSGT
jgi:hypothetical protein